MMRAATDSSSFSRDIMIWSGSSMSELSRFPSLCAMISSTFLERFVNSNIYFTSKECNMFPDIVGPVFVALAGALEKQRRNAAGGGPTGC